MNVLLCFPPNWTPTMPHLALPTLTAYLRQAGVSVTQRDLNLELFDEILTQPYMQRAASQLRRIYGPDGTRKPQDQKAAPRQQVQWALNHCSTVATKVESAKEVIRSEAFFDGPIGRSAFETVMDCLEIASLPFYPASLELQNYTAAAPVDNSRELLELVRDPRRNIFLDLYKRVVMPDIEREQPDIVGISIPSMPQMLAGMTLGYLIKETGLDCHVVVGGPHISMLRDELPNVPQIFQLFDSAVVFDGEVPLLRLVEVLDANRDADLSSVPNLIYNKRWREKETGEIIITERKTPEKIQDVPLPDFDGLPLERYLAPYTALPLLTARGCYFGKCSFCNVGYGEAESFSQLRANKLAEQMFALKEKYGVRHIFFADEAITPRNLRDLAPIMTEEGTPIHWGGCVRFEKVISQPLLESISQGGCRMILFGLESASQPIMDLMIKGTQLDHMHRILEESTQAGIWNHTFFFFGFPGETLADAQETVNFLYEHKHHINSAAMGTFLMERYSPAHRYPDSFKVKRIIEEPEKDLAIYFDFEVEEGMNNDMAELVAARFMETLPDKRYPHFYMSDVYRFLYASYNAENGLTMPPWLLPETDETVSV